MYLNRKQLKDIKKDIQEQLKSNIDIQDLYIKGMYYIGDNIFTGIEKTMLDGRLTTKELKEYDSNSNYKVYKIDELIITILEDKSINISVKAMLIDEYDYITDWEYITLNI